MKVLVWALISFSTSSINICASRGPEICWLSTASLTCKEAEPHINDIIRTIWLLSIGQEPSYACVLIRLFLIPCTERPGVSSKIGRNCGREIRNAPTRTSSKSLSKQYHYRYRIHDLGAYYAQNIILHLPGMPTAMCTSHEQQQWQQHHQYASYLNNH